MTAILMLRRLLLHRAYGGDVKACTGGTLQCLLCNVLNQDPDNKVNTDGEKHDQPTLHVIPELGRHADEQ